MIFHYRSIRYIRILFILLILFLSCMVDVPSVSAATIVVDTTVDEDATNPEACSLREAIYAARYDTAHYGCDAGSGADTITLPAGIYTVDSQLLSINTDITINGESSTTTIIQASSCNPIDESCANDHQLVWVSTSGTLSLNNLTLRHWKNTGDLNGGIIFNDGTLTITNCIITLNKGGYGGAIVNDYSSILTITNSTLSENSAIDGGAIRNSSILTITKSTLSANNASGDGGAIKNYGVLTLENSTLSANSATSQGGGIDNQGTVTITNSTLSENSGSNGGGIFNGSGDTLNFTNTIIANSTSGGDCINNGTIGTYTSNLVEDGSCSAAFSGDPLLGALADNGGPTKTHALLIGSPAIDSGNLAACPGTDQRGVTRPKGAGCDIGAYEADLSYIYLPLIMK